MNLDKNPGVFLYSTAVGMAKSQFERDGRQANHVYMTRETAEKLMDEVRSLTWHIKLDPPITLERIHGMQVHGAILPMGALFYITEEAL